MVNIVAPDLDLSILFPHLLLAGMFCLTFLLELFRPEKEASPARFLIPVASAIGLFWCFGNFPVSGAAHETAANMIIDDVLTRAVCGIVFFCLCLASLIPTRAICNSGFQNEYFALLTGSSLGMTLFVASNNLMLSFLALEIFSLGLYLLCIYLPERRAGQEASFKYFILSSLASAFMLYGMALVFGACHTTWLGEIATRCDRDSMLMLIGILLIAVGFSFKISAVPFHMWAPDVYQGAPTPVTAFMSVATKAAAMAAAYRFYVFVLGNPQVSGLLKHEWIWLFWVLALVSMVFGNLMAIAQTDIKRMLAYSGIAQAGYLLCTMQIGGLVGAKILLFYLIAYAFMNFGAFAAASGLEEDGCELTLEGLKGCVSTHPIYTTAMAVCLVGLTGLPLTGGFLGKFQILGGLLGSPNGRSTNTLAVVLILSSFLGACYYLRTVAVCFAHKRQGDYPAFVHANSENSVTGLVVALCAVGTLLTGIFGAAITQWINTFSS